LLCFSILINLNSSVSLISGLILLKFSKFYLRLSCGAVLTKEFDVFLA